jgi:hypothetical protein
LLGHGWILRCEQTKAKGAVAKARAEAEAQVMVTAATHEAGWEKIMAQASDNSWKDEAWDYSVYFV